MKIKSLKDATQFASEVKKTEERYWGIMDTPMYKGHTRYGYDQEDGYFKISEGINWTDMSRTYFSVQKFVSMVWRHRKEINRGGWESELL